MRYVIRLANQEFLKYNEFFYELIDSYSVRYLEEATLMDLDEAKRIYSLLKEKGDVFLHNQNISTTLDRIIEIEMSLREDIMIHP